jgi:hypothetical protein
MKIFGKPVLKTHFHVIDVIHTVLSEISKTKNKSFHNMEAVVCIL